MRTKFETQLEQLNTELTYMGSLVEEAIASAVKALCNQDKEEARRAMKADAQIDYMEKEIEDLCLKLLLQQQPVARDLRTISAALKMITDMERIGDQATDISEIAILLADDPNLRTLKNIPLMAEETIKMVTGSIDAFVKRDLSLAKSVIESDDIVDNLFIRVRDDLIQFLSDSPAMGSQIMDLLMVAKYFERIGDHAVNIAEWVVFSITGEHKDIDCSDSVREERVAEK